MDTSTLKRADLVPLLVDAAKKVAMRTGFDEKVEGVKGTFRYAQFRGIDVSYRGPKADIIGVPSTFGIDVWYGGKKTLSVCWNSHLIRDFELVTFKRGPWISELLTQAAEIDNK